MRQILAVSIVAMLASGCGYSGSKRVAKAGGYVILTGVAVGLLGGAAVYAFADERNDGYAAMSVAAWTGMIMAPGIVLAGAGLAGMAIHADDPPEAPSDDEAAEEGP